MKGEAAEEPPDLASLLGVVEKTLVSFGMEPAEARQRLNLWRAQQHHIEGQALEALLSNMGPEEQAQHLLRWAIEGQIVEDDLREGAAALGIDLDPPPD